MNGDPLDNELAPYSCPDCGHEFDPTESEGDFDTCWCEAGLQTQDDIDYENSQMTREEQEQHEEWERNFYG